MNKNSPFQPADIEKAFQDAFQQFPELKDNGAEMFLGKYYAHPESEILMLGINPGGNQTHKIDTALKDENCLLGSPKDEKEKYWKHARTLFGSSSELSNKMVHATFSFIIPVRTTKWTGLKPPEKRIALINGAKPITRQIISDCNPKYIIVAGSDGQSTLVHDILDLKKTPYKIHHYDKPAGFTRGTYQLQRIDVEWEDKAMTVLQIPHLSRASSKDKLVQCGQWLTQELQR